MSDKDELLTEYKRQIALCKDELKYHFLEIKRLKSMSNKYQILIDAIESYQLPLSFYN